MEVARFSPFNLSPRVTFRRVVVSLRGPGQSPVLPFACCVGSLLSVGRCSCWSPLFGGTVAQRLTDCDLNPLRKFRSVERIQLIFFHDGC